MSSPERPSAPEEDSKKSSFSVSQLEYWLKGSDNIFNNDENENEDNPEAATIKSTYLSYDAFFMLSLFFGFLGLDHLYLRSPLTALAKLIVNIMFFGVWWLYDLSHAIWSKDVIKVYGLGVPGLGPQGIAAGVLMKDKPDKNHWRFFMYAACLFIFGAFGGDSFLVGDKQSGIIRLISMITVFMAPVAIIWWVYKMVKFFFSTKSVTQQYSEYFGAPKVSMMDKLQKKYPFLKLMDDPVGWFTDLIKNTFSSTVDTVQDTVKAGIGMAAAPIKAGIGMVAAPIKGAMNKAIGPITTTAAGLVQPVTSSVKGVVNTVTSLVDGVTTTADAGLAAANAGLIVAGTALNQTDKMARTIDNTVQDVGQVASVFPVVDLAVPQTAVPQKGGLYMPQGLVNGLPNGLPQGLPTGLPQGLANGLPNGLPNGKNINTSRFLRTLVDPFVKPLTNTVQPLKTSGEKLIETGTHAGSTLKKAVNMVPKATHAAEAVTQAVATSTNALTREPDFMPPTSAYSEITKEALEQAKLEMQQEEEQTLAPGLTGGVIVAAGSNLLPYTLLGTVVVIAVAGFVLTYYRTKKHVQPSIDDTPPEPGVLRESDQKERAPRPDMYNPL